MKRLDLDDQGEPLVRSHDAEHHTLTAFVVAAAWAIAMLALAILAA